MALSGATGSVKVSEMRSGVVARNAFGSGTAATSALVGGALCVGASPLDPSKVASAMTPAKQAVRVPTAKARWSRAETFPSQPVKRVFPHEQCESGRDPPLRVAIRVRARAAECSRPGARSPNLCDGGGHGNLWRGAQDVSPL